MIGKPMDVLRDHPVRKSGAQKTAFIEDVSAFAERLGYPTAISDDKKGVRNVVIGSPEKARYMITAHYDTPCSIGLPNFIVPNNPVLFIVSQMLLVCVLVGVSVGAGYLTWFAVHNERIAFLTGYLLYLAILLLMRFGPANPSNANDNTSGVVTLLEIMSALPEHHREQVCFVLFDKEEQGLVGSKAYRKAHLELTENMIVLNLDCVGDGDVIQMTPIKKARANEALLSSLSRICGKSGGKEITLRAKGFYGGNSDHKNFPNGVAIMAFRYRKGIGLYCNRIHTWRDKNLDETNVALLRDALVSMVTAPEDSITQTL